MGQAAGEKGKHSTAELPCGDFSFEDALTARLLQDRIVILNGEIDEWQARNLTLQLSILSQKEAPITLLITSEGGAVDAGGAVIHAIRKAQLSDCPVSGEVRGYAMSMACVVLQECAFRFLAPEGIVMVHGASGASIGDIRNQEQDLKLTKNLMDIHARLFAERNTSTDNTFHDEQYWRKILDDNCPHFYIGAEALAAGLVDELID